MKVKVKVKMKSMVEFCAGSATVASAFKAAGCITWTTDIFQKDGKIDKVANIMELTPDDIPDADFIWFSPPCNTFSIANLQAGHWDKTKPLTKAAEDALALVEHGIELILKKDPAYFIIENPRGLLRLQPLMKKFPRVTVTYCQYGSKIQKPTDLWGRFPTQWKPRSCRPGASCHQAAPRGSTGGLQGVAKRDRAIVPYPLAHELASAARNDFPRSSWARLEEWC